MGFDAWSLTSQETSLITEVFVDEVLQLPLFLNTGGFFREGIERWVSLGKSHNHQVTETLTSSLYSNVFSLNTVCIEKKKKKNHLLSVSCFAEHEFWHNSYKLLHSLFT